MDPIAVEHLNKSVALCELHEILRVVFHLIKSQMIIELNEGILDSVLGNVPNLTSLHVVGCPKLDHTIILKHIPKVPLLQSLSMTTSVSPVRTQCDNF